MTGRGLFARAHDTSRSAPAGDALPIPTVYNPGPRQYYEKYDQLCDWIVRCDDCRTLVTTETIHQTGCCHKCGSHKFKEPRTLSPWEWLKIKIGLLRFPHSAEFLASFTANAAKVPK
jgi:hypothetical protein